MKTLALIGCGAIARSVLELLRDDAGLRVTQVLVPEDGLAEARAACARLAPQARVSTTLDLNGLRPDLVAECAGHSAVQQHVLPALRAGVPAVVASIGALHDAASLAELEDAARQGDTRVSLVSGAIGGIDALGAARIGGLDSVEYVGRKPPLAWLGTPAEALCDLRSLSEPRVIFEGSAREAASLYPKNANVAATVSLAGLGFDRTRATLIADPTVTRNAHRIVAIGAFGRMDLALENEPLAANPKTSALTVYSVVRALQQASRPVSL